MWQTFTESARKAIFFAQEAAQRYGEGYVSTEHLLLGLVRVDDCAACRVMQTLGVSPARVQDEVAKHLPSGQARPSQDMTLTPRAKRVIDLAYDEARNLNNNYIGTEHLLLGLLREGDGLAGRVLITLGIELDRARFQAINLQDGEGTKRVAASTPPPASPRAAHRHAYSFNPAPYFHIRQGRYVAEHLFLMLVADPDSDSAKVASQALDQLRGLQLEVEGFMLSLGQENDSTGPTALQRILDRAAEEAKALGHSRVLLRHMLLALAFEDDSFIQAPLKEKLEELRQAAKELPE